MNHQAITEQDIFERYNDMIVQEVRKQDLGGNLSREELVVSLCNQDVPLLFLRELFNLPLKEMLEVINKEVIDRKVSMKGLRACVANSHLPLSTNTENWSRYRPSKNNKDHISLEFLYNGIPRFGYFEKEKAIGEPIYVRNYNLTIEAFIQAFWMIQDMNGYKWYKVHPDTVEEYPDILARIEARDDICL